MRVAPPPSRVTLPPPSITVLRSVGTAIGDVTRTVTGSAPQLNVTISRLATAARNAASVQLPGVPSPTLGEADAVSSATTGGVQTPATGAGEGAGAGDGAGDGATTAPADDTSHCLTTPTSGSSPNPSFVHCALPPTVIVTHAEPLP